LFAENSTDNPGSFSVNAGRTIYVPPDPKLNLSPGVSDRFALPLYYVTASFSDSVTLTPTYKNSDNLLFQRVAVASKKQPEFLPNENALVIVPSNKKYVNHQSSGQISYSILDFDLNVQLAIFDWSKLSEEDRIAAGQRVNNIVLNALYADPTRGDNATFYSTQLDGTDVGQIVLQPSKDVLRGTIKVQCAYMVNPTGY
jgi:hypothetical protein